MVRRIVLLVYLMVQLSACVFLNVTVPLDKDVNNSELGEKIGKAKTHSVLWLIAWGDGGTAAAARAGNIQRVQHLDVRYYSILFGLYSSRETIAYGD